VQFRFQIDPLYMYNLKLTHLKLAVKN
jgi:hypothetical protein